MKAILLGLGLAISTLLHSGGQAQPPTSKQEPGYATVGAAPCTPIGEIRFICTIVSPEDLAIVPGAEWVIASGNREGGRLHLRLRDGQEVEVSRRQARLLKGRSSIG